jgi:hypothetical protein
MWGPAYNGTNPIQAYKTVLLRSREEVEAIVRDVSIGLDEDSTLNSMTNFEQEGLMVTFCPNESQRWSITTHKNAYIIVISAALCKSSEVPNRVERNPGQTEGVGR